MKPKLQWMETGCVQGLYRGSIGVAGCWAWLYARTVRGEY